MADFQFGDDLVVESAVKEVGEREVLGLRAQGFGARGEVLVGDDEAGISRQVVDGAVFHVNGKARILHFFAQHAGTGRA